MAKKSSKGQEGNKIDTKANAKLADIYTAAKSTMEPANYEKGYPRQPETLRQGVWQGKLLEKGK